VQQIGKQHDNSACFLQTSTRLEKYGAWADNSLVDFTKLVNVLKAAHVAVPFGEIFRLFFFVRRLLNGDISLAEVI
jgi:hypothetical protein